MILYHIPKKRTSVLQCYLQFISPPGEDGRILAYFMLNYEWFEEPFRDFELYKYSELCRTVDISIAATETTRGCHWGVAQNIAQHAADIVRADVSWKDGITGTLKIAHTADSFGLNCEIHTTTMNYMDLANVHVSCSIRNCKYFEYFVF